MNRLGQHLLADACLTQDQHRDVSGCRSGGKLVDAAHLLIEQDGRAGCTRVHFPVGILALRVLLGLNDEEHRAKAKHLAHGNLDTAAGLEPGLDSFRPLDSGSRREPVARAVQQRAVRASQVLDLDAVVQVDGEVMSRNGPVVHTDVAVAGPAHTQPPFERKGIGSHLLPDIHEQFERPRA